MARATTQNSVINPLRQTVYVGNSPAPYLWCTSINYSAGVGASSATFTLPYAYANDPALRSYRYPKVTVFAGTGASARTLFIGYLSADTSDASASDESVTLVAHTAGYFLGKHEVGQEAGHWRAVYRVFDDRGVPTGWTPLRVLMDMMLRLPESWQAEIKLGNVLAISNAQDLPVQSYDFSLSSYADAIDGIAASLGDVMVVEYFAYGVTWLNFVMVNAINAPVARARVARWTADTQANVVRFSDQCSLEPVANQAIFFGTDKEFLITSRSVVEGWSDLSEPALAVPPPPEGEPAPDPVYPTALVNDWDEELEAIALADPSLTQSDKVSRSCIVKQWQWANTKQDGNTANADGSSDQSPAPGTSLTVFYAKCGATLIPNKTILRHKSGERMLVTIFVPGTEAHGEITSPTPEPATTEKHALIGVERLYQANVGDTGGDIQYEDCLEIEIPGLSNVFRQFKLPKCLEMTPKREFQSTIPWLDADGNRRPAQSFVFKSVVTPDAANPNRRYGIAPVRPTLIDGTRFDFDNMKIKLGVPAVTVDEEVVVTYKNSSATGQEIKESKRVKTTYRRTPCGVTFSYIDPAYPFGYQTAALTTGAVMPFAIQASRQKFDDYKFQQMTNQGYPAGGYEFQAILMNPDTGDLTNGYDIIRNDLAELGTAAWRELLARYRLAYSATVEIPWVDTNYAIGQQLRIDGLLDPPRDRLTVTGVSYDMSVEGDHSTTLVCDNRRPPKRQRFNTKLRRAS